MNDHTTRNLAAHNPRRVTFRAALLAAIVLGAPLTAHAELEQQVVFEASTYPQQWANSLTRTSDGAVYGTTAGFNNINGSIFKLAESSATPLLSFSGKETVHSGLTEGPDGNLYGTIESGTSVPSGAVFRINKAGKLDTLHTFDDTDGALPAGPVVVAADGTIYGTTYYGGEGSGKGFGTVFKLELPDTLTTLHDFGVDDGAVGGANPRSRLVLAPDGTLYGTTTTGGELEEGTVFRITPEGEFGVVAAFGGSRGSGPHDLLLHCNGNLYGRAFGGQGSVFELSTAGKVSTLHTLSGDEGEMDFNTGDGPADGGALTLAANGKLYGVATYGGTTPDGTVFELATDGAFQVLYTFKGTADYGRPLSILQAEDGDLLGTFHLGRGGVFRLVLPEADKAAVECSPPDVGAGGAGGTDGGGGGTTAGTAGQSPAGAAGEPQAGAAGEPPAGGSGGGSGGTEEPTAGTTSAGGTDETPGSSGKSGGCSFAPTKSWSWSSLVLGLALLRRSATRV